MKKSYSRKLSLLLALVVCFAIMAGGCGNTQQPEPSGSQGTPGTETGDNSDGIDYGPAVTLSFGSSSAAEDITTKGMKLMQQIIEEKSGGKITLKLYPASQLGASIDMVEMVSQGSLDMMIEGTYLPSFGVTNANASSVAFTYETREEFIRMQESDLMKEWQDEFREKNNIRILADNWYRNFSCIISKKPVYTLDDMAGLKLRVPQIETSLKSWEKTGCSPTPVAYSEALLSLQQGVIDAVWVTQDAAYSMGFYEVAKYLTEVKAHTDALMIYFNEDKFQSLTDAQRELIVSAAEQAGEYYSSIAADTLEENNTAMEEAGVEIISLSSEEWNRFADVVRPIGYELEAAGEWPEGLFDRVLSIARGEE